MVAIYLDSASIPEMHRWHDKVDGYTSNPTLMRKAGVTDYKSFAMDAIALGKPISLEVISDDFTEMERQARLLSSWGSNVWVKIPITNTKGESSIPLIRRLTDINLNITAVMDWGQWGVFESILKPTDILSIFAGRMMDTQYWPFHFSSPPTNLKYQKLWASAREVFHVKLAEDFGYDIITLTPDLIAKLDLKGKNLTQYSLETVQMFYNDAQKAGYIL